MLIYFFSYYYHYLLFYLFIFISFFPFLKYLVSNSKIKITKIGTTILEIELTLTTVIDPTNRYDNGKGDNDDYIKDDSGIDNENDNNSSS